MWFAFAFYRLILQETPKEQIPTDISDFIEKIVHDEDETEEEVEINHFYLWYELVNTESDVFFLNSVSPKMLYIQLFLLLEVKSTSATGNIANILPYER